METKSAVLGAAGMLVALGAVFGALGIANADNQPEPAPAVTTSAPVETTAPISTPEPVVTTEAPEPVAEPAPVVEPAPAEPAPVYVAPEPAPAPAPVYVAPAGESPIYSYSKPTEAPVNGPDPIKNTGRYDQPVTGELYLNPADVPKG
jgi:outer membrane biosynthesis protein TonB